MENKCFRFIQTLSAAVFEYDTVKLVHIRNQKIGFVYRLVQLAIIGYILGYVIIYKKGYQETDLLVSSVTTKVKGTALDTTKKLWDVADYVVPPEETNAVFVTTSAIITTNQTRGVCPEATGLANCTSDKDCPPDQYVTYGNGIRTGQCDNQTKSCFIRAWCPVEDDRTPPVPLLGNATKNFTLLIKNSIRYKKFNFFKRNVLQGANSSYLHQCKFNKNHPVDQFCPIFVLSQMVEDAGSDWESLALNASICMYGDLIMSLTPM
jgi:cation transporter protein